MSAEQSEEIRLRSMIQDGKLNLSQVFPARDHNITGIALVHLLQDPAISLTSLHFPAYLFDWDRLNDDTKAAIIESIKELLLRPNSSVTELSLPRMPDRKSFIEFLDILKTNKTLTLVKFESDIRSNMEAEVLEQILKLNSQLKTLEFVSIPLNCLGFVEAGLRANQTLLSFGETIYQARSYIDSTDKPINIHDSIAPLLARNRDLEQKRKSETLAKSLRHMEKVYKTQFFTKEILKDIGRMADLPNKSESEAIDRREQRAAVIRTKNARNVEAEIGNELDATDLLVKLITDLKPEIAKLSETTDKATLTKQCNEILDNINIQTEEILLSKKPLLNKDSEKLNESFKELSETFKDTDVALRSNMPIIEFEKSEMQNAKKEALDQIVNRLNRFCDLMIQPKQPTTQSKSPKGP